MPSLQYFEIDSCILKYLYHVPVEIYYQLIFVCYLFLAFSLCVINKL